MIWKKLMSLFMSAALSASFVCGSLSCPVTAADTADGTADVSTESSEISAKGTNPIGDLLAADMSEELEQKPLVKGYAIYEVNVDGNLVTARIEAATDCRLVVGIYSDAYNDGAEQLYGTTIIQASAGTSEVDARLSIDPMPQYFKVRAYMIGADDVPLTAEYSNPMYTKNMRDLLASDIHDYDDYSTINLDGDENTNFLVYQKDVKFAVSEGTKNILTHEDGTDVYTIRNYDGPTEQGAIVSVVTDSQFPTVFRIASAETADGVTTIHADPTLRSEDVFAYAKLESDEHVTNGTYVPPETTEDGPTVTVLDQPRQQRPSFAPAEEDGSAQETGETIHSETFQIRLRLEKKSGKSFGQQNAGLGDQVTDEYEDHRNAIGVSFEAGYSIGVDLTATVKWDYYISLTDTHFDNEVTFDGELTGEIVLSGTLTLPLGTTSLWIGSCVTLIVSPVLRVEAYAAVTFTEQLRLHYKTNEGWNNNSDVDKLKLTGSFFIGIGFVAEFKLFDHIGANLEALAGIRFNGTIAPRHEGCSLCIEGEWGFEASVTFYAGVSFIPGADFMARAILFVPLGDFYVSIPNGLGYGKCPNANKLISDDPDDPGHSGQDDPGQGNPQIDDGLTEEQRDCLQFFQNPTQISAGGMCVEVKKDHIGSLTSIQLPAFYQNQPVTRIGSGIGNSGISSAYNHKYSCTFAPLADCSGGFSYCSTVRDIYIPCTVREIEEYAFINTSSLQRLQIPSSVDRIGKGAFFKSGLTQISLPGSLKELETCVFLDCDKLRSVTFPSSLESIGAAAFEGCSSLTSVTLPRKLKKLGDCAFADCKSLRNVRIPKSVKSFGMNTFVNCDALEWILIENPEAEIGAPDDLFGSFNREKIKIYGYTDSTAQTFAEEYDFTFVPLDPRPAVTTAPAVTEPAVTEPSGSDQPAADPPKTMTFTGLEPNTVYNFYDLLGDDFTAENLLYLSQGISDANGTLTVWYRPKADDTAANKYVKCISTEATTTTSGTTTTGTTCETTGTEPAATGSETVTTDGTTVSSVTTVTGTVSEIRGDANGDFSVDVSDAVLIARFCAEDATATITRQGIVNADANHDGNINSMDTIMILRYIAKIIPSLG